MNPATVQSGQPLMTQAMQPDLNEQASQALEAQHERWNHVHVNWTAVWLGALAAFSAVLVFGLIGLAVGAHLVGPEHRVVDLHNMGMFSLIFSICAAFFAFIIGGWIAGKVAGILHAEPGMLHGGIAWLLAVPMLLAATSVGAGSLFGGWYSGLAGHPSWAAVESTPFTRPEAPAANATIEERAAYQAQMTDYNQKVHQWNEDTPRAVRNSALGAVTALLLGLIGSVIGGWAASGEPMNFTHYRSRKPMYHIPA